MFHVDERRQGHWPVTSLISSFLISLILLISLFPPFSSPLSLSFLGGASCGSIPLPVAWKPERGGNRWRTSSTASGQQRSSFCVQALHVFVPCCRLSQHQPPNLQPRLLLVAISWRIRLSAMTCAIRSSAFGGVMKEPRWSSFIPHLTQHSHLTHLTHLSSRASQLVFHAHLLSAPLSSLSFLLPCTVSCCSNLPRRGRWTTVAPFAFNVIIKRKTWAMWRSPWNDVGRREETVFQATCSCRRCRN